MHRILLRPLQWGANPFHFSIPAADPILAGGDWHLLGPVRVEGALLKKEESLLILAAQLYARVEVPCRRCLDPCSEEIRAPLRLVIRLEGRRAGAEAQEDAGDDAMILVSSETTQLDLGERIREAFILEYPVYPLCRPDCRGICPQCGQNLNGARCQCPPPSGAPRWGVLARVRGSLGEGLPSRKE